MIHFLRFERYCQIRFPSRQNHGRLRRAEEEIWVDYDLRLLLHQMLQWARPEPVSLCHHFRDLWRALRFGLESTEWEVDVDVEVEFSYESA